jgi:hypothetical protein
VNEPSAASVALTSLTITDVIAAPPIALGTTVPVTVIVPAAVWIKLRCGAVIVSVGGSPAGVGPPLQADAARSNPETSARFRMAVPTFSKAPAKSPTCGRETRTCIRGQFRHNASRRSATRLPWLPR